MVLYLIASCSYGNEEMTINIPERLVIIENGEKSEVEYKHSEKPILLCYFSQKDCSVCVTEKLDTYYKKIKSSKIGKAQFEIMFMLSPKQEDKCIVEHILEVKKFYFPVLIDTDNEIEKLNDYTVFSKRYILLDANLNVLKKSNNLWLCANTKPL